METVCYRIPLQEPGETDSMVSHMLSWRAWKQTILWSIWRRLWITPPDDLVGLLPEIPNILPKASHGISVPWIPYNEVIMGSSWGPDHAATEELCR